MQTPEFNVVGAPGYDPGRLQQSAAPVYKTELHASADAVLMTDDRGQSRYLSSVV